jgi:tripartite-type tricarboxylate transporter receptor subunit TctC
VPSAPGGVTDALARLLGEQIGRTQGVTVVIDNRPGAGEVIGTETAARRAGRKHAPVRSQSVRHQPAPAQGEL